MHGEPRGIGALHSQPYAALPKFHLSLTSISKWHTLVLFRFARCLRTLWDMIQFELNDRLFNAVPLHLPVFRHLHRPIHSGKLKNMREIVHIQGGQCGNQIGAKVCVREHLPNE